MKIRDIFLHILFVHFLVAVLIYITYQKLFVTNSQVIVMREEIYFMNLDPILGKGDSVSATYSSKIIGGDDRDFKSEYKNVNDVATLEELHQIIWKQIESLQEEGDCEAKKILYCENSRNVAGLGSMVHRYGVCMQIAYGLGRIWFINQRQYDHFGGLNRFLKPESKKCGYLKEKYKHAVKYNLQNKSSYEANGYDVDNTHKIMVYDLVPAFPHPRHIPTTIPYSIEKILLKFNVSQPWVWFTSHFIGYYLLRPNENFMAHIKNISNVIDLKHPYVAMHIRRGDKIASREASLTHERVYLNAAEKYFQEHLPNITRRVIYLASDQYDMKSKLKILASNKYQILSRPSFGSSRVLTNRLTLEAIETMLIDLYFLTHSNYTICTYSSNIGRLIYELKQTIAPYISVNRVVTVDYPSYIDYSWYGYMNWFFYLYYVTTRNNSHERDIDQRKMLKYNSGQLVEFNNITHTFYENGTEVVLCYIRTKYKERYKLKEIEGYVLKEHLKKWPGQPTYYFYP